MKGIEVLRRRIEASLEKNKKDLVECKQFWFGYLTALSENGVLKDDVYRELRDFVCFYGPGPAKKIEKRLKNAGKVGKS